MEVTLKGLNQRGKNRIREHGNTFTLLQRGDWKGTPALLVESIKGKWWGWLEVGSEVEEVLDILA